MILIVAYKTGKENTMPAFEMKVRLWDLPQVTNRRHSSNWTAEHIHQWRLHEHNDVTISNTQD